MNDFVYRCPTCHGKMARTASTSLVCVQGHAFPVDDGLPDFVPAQQFNEEQQQSSDYYDQSAAIYDDVADLSFRIQRVDEASARREFVKLLSLKADDRVLEIAPGTGRDALNIVELLGPSGTYCGLDLSRAMLRRCRTKLVEATEQGGPRIELAVGSASRLPFADQSFDALFSFGGINVFPDVAHCLREMARVCRPGARIVVGDESLGPWLYESEYGRILLNNTALFRHLPPLHLLPIEARKVRLQWVVGAAYYLIDFEVGVGEPPADFDIEIPGARGGTLRTRYHGKLEGVSPDTLALARRAREKSGQSMHDWLDAAVRAAALKTLKEDGTTE